MMINSLNVELSLRAHLKPARSLLRRSHVTTRCCALGLVAALAALTQTPVRAADGCVVLLCLAAPSWRALPQCVPPIRQVLRDLVRSKPFPVCGMAGRGNSAEHA